MSQKHILQLTDDLDQTEVAEGGQTVTFALQMTQYEIDLSQTNAQRLYDVLAPFIAAGRRVGVQGRSRGDGTLKAESNQTPAIRQWAKSQGMAVSDRGRLPKVVHLAYNAATSRPV